MCHVKLELVAIGKRTGEYFDYVTARLSALSENPLQAIIESYVE